MFKDVRLCFYDCLSGLCRNSNRKLFGSKPLLLLDVIVCTCEVVCVIVSVVVTFSSPRGAVKKEGEYEKRKERRTRIRRRREAGK